MTTQLTVFGYPIAHSLSPTIHHAFAKEFGIDLSYTKTEVNPGTFKQAIESFYQSGGIGANITVPYKEEAYELCDQLSAAAKRAQAVNTLYCQNDVLWGTNTDGPGLVQDIIHNQNQILSGKRILILGAGGAARGIVGPLLDQAPRSLTIANRTFAKAADLSEAFHKQPLPLGFEDLKVIDATFEIIINATSASLEEKSLEVPGALFKDAFVYDLMYAKTRQTPFTKWAHDQGAAQSCDGLGMLIEQAALAFEVWFKQKPNTKPIFELIESKCSS